MTQSAAASASVPREPADHRGLVDTAIVRWYLVAGLAFMVVSMLAGFLFSMQFLQHYPLKGMQIFSPGRWRLIHTNAIAYGFIANVFLGMLHWAIPRMTLKPVLDRRLSWFIFLAWQAIVLATAVGLLLGQAQALEWGETPTWIDPLAQLGLILVAVNFLTPILRTSGPMYVSLWYFVAGLVWTIMVYAMGNFIPQYFFAGAPAGAIGGMFIHDLVGLFVTPLGWGMMYYAVPILLRKPIWSHGLSLIGFWGLAFFYPLTGIHHFLYSPIPMFLQYGAVISTIAVEFVVATVIINFFATLHGSADALRTNLPVRWYYTGMINYFITCLQCAFQTTLTFQKIIHFSDWVVAHAHLVMFGVFGFWLLGFIVQVFPRVVGRTAWYSRRLLEWMYWIIVLSMAVMFVDLTIAGLVQGFAWRDLTQWEATLRASYPFWLVRTISGTGMIVGIGLFVYNLAMTWVGKTARTPAYSVVPHEPAPALATA